MAQQSDTAQSEPKNVSFRLHLDGAVLTIRYKDKDDLFESLKEKLADLGIPITSVYATDRENEPFQLKDADSIAEVAMGDGRHPVLFARCPNDDTHSGDCEHASKPRPHSKHRSHGRWGHRHRSSSSDSSTSSSSSSERGSHHSKGHGHHHGHHPHHHGHHPHHHGHHHRSPSPPPYFGSFFGPFGHPMMGSGGRSCPFFGHGFGGGHGRGYGFGRGGHCPAFGPPPCPGSFWGPFGMGFGSKSCPFSGPGFGHGHEHKFGRHGHGDKHGPGRDDRCPASDHKDHSPAAGHDAHDHGSGSDGPGSPKH